MNNLTVRSIDIMKWTKDTRKSQIPDSQKAEIIKVLAANFNLTHIAIAPFLNKESDYLTPSIPDDQWVHTKKWVDLIHARGLNVIFRGDYSDYENNLDDVLPLKVGSNRIPVGTVSSAPTDGQSTMLGRIYDVIIQNPDWFEEGDIWAPMPERTEDNTTVEGISITSSGTLATVTLNGHRFITGMYLTIAGATQPNYNGYFQITKINANQFTYVMPGSAASPATGSPTVEYGVSIYEDNFAILPAGGDIGVAFNNFLIDVHEVSDAAFAAISKTGILTGMTSNNFSEVASGFLSGAFFTDADKAVFDHYGITHTPEEMDEDHRDTYAAKGVQTFHQEWSDIYNGSENPRFRLEFLEKMYKVFTKLAEDGIMYGLNYWGGWLASTHTEGILLENGDGTYSIDEKGKLLARFFRTGKQGRKAFLNDPLFPALGEGSRVEPSGERTEVERNPNLVVNGNFADGATGWTLSADSSIVAGDSPYLESNLASDNFNQTYQTITLDKETIYELEFEYYQVMNDPTIVTAGTGTSSLNNSRVVLHDNDGAVADNTPFIGESPVWVKRKIIFNSKTITNFRLGFMPRRAGVTRYRNITLKKLFLPRSGYRKPHSLGLPSIKGGNFGEFKAVGGGDLATSWLSDANFTPTNRNAWKADFEDLYMANGIKVIRLFINVFGDYASNLNMVNSDWSALNAQHAANLSTFFEEDIPDGMKVVVVLGRHTGLPNSVLNTSLTPSPAYQTRANWLARLVDAVNILKDYGEKIVGYEAANELNLNVGASLPWGKVQEGLAAAYTAIKTADPDRQVIISHQNLQVYMHPTLLLADTADAYGFHWYAKSHIQADSGTFLYLLPEMVDKPLFMGECGDSDYNTVEGNLQFHRVAYDFYYKLGFECIMPWIIASYIEDNQTDYVLDWVPPEERINN